MVRTREITNSEDVIDSREIIARLEELEESLALTQCPEGWTLKEWESELEEKHLSGTATEEEESAYENIREYGPLKELAEECEGLGDWEFGETLIRESYWEDYCEEMCKDTGVLPQEIPWWIVIDWTATADNMAQDYTTVEFDRVTYYIRS